MRRVVAGVCAAVAALAGCSGGDSGQAPTAMELVKELTTAGVCTRPSKLVPGSNSWTCQFPRATTGDKRYLVINAFATPAELNDMLALLLRCPSTVSIDLVRGPTWVANVAAITPREGKAVMRTIGGRTAPLKCSVASQPDVGGTTTTSVGAVAPLI